MGQKISISETDQPKNRNKHLSLTLVDYPHFKQLGNGHTIVRLDDNLKGLLYTQTITLTNHQGLIQKWVKWSFPNSCNILRYQSEVLSVFCSPHVRFKVLLEYGDYSLAQLLQDKRELLPLDKSQLTIISDRVPISNLVNIEFIKFMLQTIDQYSKTFKTWITFHTTNIIYFKKLKKYKYLFLPDFEEHHERQTFYDPSNNDCIATKSEEVTVFSLGMVLLSLLLGEDSSSCYNYQNMTFIWSIFEEKKQLLQEKLTFKGKFFKEDSISMVGLSFEEQIVDLTLEAISPKQCRPSFQQIKKKFYKILRNISYNYQIDYSETQRRSQLLPRKPKVSKRNKMHAAFPFEEQEKKAGSQKGTYSDDSSIMSDLKKIDHKGKKYREIRKLGFMNSKRYGKENLYTLNY